MEDDWDLHAVVRGCAAITTAATTTTTQVLTTAHQNCNSTTPFFEHMRESFVQEELHDLYKPFLANPLHSSQILLSPLSVLQDPPCEHQIITQSPFQQHKHQPFSLSDVSKATPRSKKRKNSMKRVSHVTVDNLSSDTWSWRKYGQKPIKGSPYPRGYYRCSTSKLCMARKQVERNRSDPGMFIITYTGEHNHPMPTHRNSLAGSTRHKTAETPNSDEPSKPTPSPEIFASPAPEKLESSREELEDDNDDDFSVSKMEVDDDFFAGLEEFTPAESSECTDSHFPAKLEFPWLSTTIAGGG